MGEGIKPRKKGRAWGIGVGGAHEGMRATENCRGGDEGNHKGESKEKQLIPGERGSAIKAYRVKLLTLGGEGSNAGGTD